MEIIPGAGAKTPRPKKFLAHSDHSGPNSRTIEWVQLKVETKTLANTTNMKTNSNLVSYHAFAQENLGIIDRDQRESDAGVAETETADLAQSLEPAQWPDARLIASVCCDCPDEAALDVLVARHWDTVFARCQVLTQNYDKALDLAQATWCRLLRARQNLRPCGNFPAYLATIATNLFRDSYRASRRAGPMAEYRLESLEAARTDDDGEGLVLVDVVADLKSQPAHEQALLAIDLDAALKQLAPLLREAVVARFIDGESCAEIGLRHGRTEQTVSGWVREALCQLKSHLEEPPLLSEPALAFSAVESAA
jgi:RNA polymerase sigma factor (sigma-70 family)